MAFSKSLHTLTAIRQTAAALEKEWGVHPLIVLSCMGGEDEHWQFFDPRDVELDAEPMPYCIVTKDGAREFHP